MFRVTVNVRLDKVGEGEKRSSEQQSLFGEEKL
jgi:hypothetical protein